jgi:hypothetical protein
MAACRANPSAWPWRPEQKSTNLTMVRFVNFRNAQKRQALWASDPQANSQPCSHSRIIKFDKWPTDGRLRPGS